MKPRCLFCKKVLPSLRLNNQVCCDMNYSYVQYDKPIKVIPLSLETTLRIFINLDKLKEEVRESGIKYHVEPSQEIMESTEYQLIVKLS